MEGRLAGQFNPFGDSGSSSDYDSFDSFETPKKRNRGAQELDATLDTIQNGLSMAGMLPGVGVVPDLVNAAGYAARGKWGEAGMSALMAIPLLGDMFGVKKVADNTARAFGQANALKAGERTMGY